MADQEIPLTAVTDIIAPIASDLAVSHITAILPDRTKDGVLDKRDALSADPTPMQDAYRHLSVDIAAFKKAVETGTQETLARFDRNHNGSLSWPEAQAMQSYCAALSVSPASLDFIALAKRGTIVTAQELATPFIDTLETLLPADLKKPEPKQR